MVCAEFDSRLPEFVRRLCPALGDQGGHPTARFQRQQTHLQVKQRKICALERNRPDQGDKTEGNFVDNALHALTLCYNCIGRLLPDVEVRCARHELLDRIAPGFDANVRVRKVSARNSALSSR